MQKFIARNSLIVTLFMGISAILGLVRESSVAYMFGASGTTDAYLIAMIIPTLVSGLISGSITSVFITVYASFLARGEQARAARTANIVLSFFLVVLSAICIVFLVFTPGIISLLAPTYTGERLALTVSLTRIVVPNLLFGGLLGVLVGINNSHHSFIAPAVNGLAANLVVLSSIFTLGAIWGIHGLAVGSLLGIIAQFLIQIISARKYGFRYKFVIDIGDPGLKEIAVLVAPFIFSAAAGQVNLIVDRTLATGLPAGAVSALYFSDKLVFLPNLFTGSVATVVFPLMVNAAALEDWDRLVEGIKRGVRLLSLLLFPCVVGIFVLRIPFVRLLFEHGKFSGDSTAMTGEVVPFFLGALFFGALVSVLVNVFLAVKKAYVPVATGVAAMAINVALSLLLIRPLQQRGLALANSLSTFINLMMLIAALFMIVRLHEKAKVPVRDLLLFFSRVGLCGVMMGVAVLGYIRFIEGHLGTGALSTFTTVSAVAVGAMVYGCLTYVMGVEEVRQGLAWLLTKLKKRRTGNA